MSNLWTCQVCGRAIKARAGVIAHHGYKRPGQGWQTPSCYGARALPYQLAHDALDRLIADLLGRFIPAKEVSKATHTTAPYPEKLVENVRTGAWTATKLVDRARPDGWNPTANSHDQYMPGTYGHAWFRRASEIEIDLQRMRETLEDARKAVANWKAPTLETREAWVAYTGCAIPVEAFDAVAEIVR